MKKLGFILMAFVCLLAVAVKVNAEEGEEPEIVPNTVVVNEVQHAEYELNITEGNVGDIVELQVNPSLFYIIENVTVNGVVLVEDEAISGLFKFELAEGENIITISVILDKQLLGEVATIYENATADGEFSWENLFSVENIVTIVKWLLDGGILIAFARYFLKNKELEQKTEVAINKTMEKIIPEATKETVIKSIEENIAPTFVEMSKYFSDIQTGLSTMAKCMALMQENTPEAKLAVLEALNNLNIGDKDAVNASKTYIEDLVKQSEAKYAETMEAIAKIKESNEAKETPVIDDGTTI